MSEFDFLKILYGAITYGVWSILLGFFVLDLAPYAAILSAVGAGIYVGRNSKPNIALASGLMAGLVGGIATGILSVYINNIGGISLSVSVTSFLTPVILSITPSKFLFPVTSLALIGLLFGALGGLLGSIKKLRGFFLFIALFFLFIIYGAIDNAAWNILKPGWTWYMSFQHVLTNETDLVVALIYSAFVTLLAYITGIW